LIWAGGSAIIVGMFSPLFDQSPWRRGWHDRVAGAVMTDVRGVPPAYAPPAAPAAMTPGYPTQFGGTPQVMAPQPYLPPASTPAAPAQTPVFPVPAQTPAAPARPPAFP